MHHSTETTTKRNIGLSVSPTTLAAPTNFGALVGKKSSQTANNPCDANFTLTQISLNAASNSVQMAAQNVIFIDQRLHQANSDLRSAIMRESDISNALVPPVGNPFRD